MGKCSLTVALPILSAMGLSTSVLPTAVLSTHTGFPSPVVQPMTENLLPFADHMASVGGEFDTLCTGYLSDPHQAKIVCRILDNFEGLKVIDPAMGDHGKLYSRMTEEHVEAMKELCKRGDILLPNLTEAAFLTGIPYRENPNGMYLIEMAEALCEFGPKGVIITGVDWSDGMTGWGGMQNGRFFSYQNDRIPTAYHGTGDIFSSVAVGGCMAGLPLDDAMKLAADYTARTIEVTMKNPKKPWYGVDFEAVIPWLVNELQDMLKK
jgi:pyridoxine kinase